MKSVTQLELALLQLEGLKKQQKNIKKQIRNRKSIISKILIQAKEIVQQP